MRFEPLPPPTQGQVERLLRGVHHRVLRLLEKRGALPAQGPEDALQAYQAHSLQQRLRWTEVDARPPPSKQPDAPFASPLTEPHSPFRSTSRLWRQAAWSGSVARQARNSSFASSSRPAFA